MTVLIGEGHFTDRLDAGLNGVARGHVDGSEHAHFQIGSGISHEWVFGLPVPAHGPMTEWGLFTPPKLPEGGAGAAEYCRVVAHWKIGPGKTRRRQCGQKPFPPTVSTQERTLKTKLKIRRWTRTARKGDLEMVESLQHRIGVGACRWREFAAKPFPQRVQPAPEFAPQPIPRFQREGQRELLHGSLERKSGQQLHQPSPQPRSGESVTRQNIGQKKGEGASATATLTPVGTKHPLAPERPPVGRVGIIAQQTTVPVQRPDAAAMRTRRLLEGKSWSFNSGRSRTK